MLLTAPQQFLGGKMTDRELLQIAFNAMDSVNHCDSNNGLYSGCFDLEVKALRARLARPEREWVGLTEQEHTELAIECGCLSADWVFYGAAVEQKLKETNT